MRVGSEYDNRDGQRIKVWKQYHHSRYKKAQTVDAHYNYGVVILADKIEFNDRVSNVRLPTTPCHQETLMTLAGYGEGHKLQYTKIPLYNMKKCVCTYRRVRVILNPEVTLCAGFEHANTTATATAGDTGSSLVSNGHLYGIVSYRDTEGTLTRLRRYPAVFAKVVPMAEWYRAFIDQMNQY